MTDLRDQFAIAALPKLMGNLPAKDAAIEAYKMADLMIAEREKDTVESKDQIKQMLVDAIKKEHPGLSASTVCTAEHLIFQLTTGMQF
jgi:hypothetical protein